jgi:hypothetical protein
MSGLQSLFGDANKPYLGGHLKGLSLTLDSLSRELGVLFVVSAGNYRIGEDSPEGLAWRDNYPHYLLDEGWRLIEPAPALNVLTVGSLARHNQSYNSQRYPTDPAEIPIAQPDQPSPFTRSGFSVNGAIKPELVEHGGNWALDARGGLKSPARPRAGARCDFHWPRICEGQSVCAGFWHKYGRAASRPSGLRHPLGAPRRKLQPVARTVMRTRSSARSQPELDRPRQKVPAGLWLWASR